MLNEKQKKKKLLRKENIIMLHDLAMESIVTFIIT